MRQPDLEPRRQVTTDRPSLSELRLRNPNVLCYINASVLALMHVNEVLGGGELALEALREDDIEEAHARYGSALITSMRSFPGAFGGMGGHLVAAGCRGVFQPLYHQA